MASTASERARPSLDPWRHQGVRVDAEPDGAGRVVRAATLFLTGSECPWRCVMCDLWRYTTLEDTPVGAIPHQIADALASLREDPDPPPIMKLYNAGSFFDPRAVPPADDEAIGALLSTLRRVVVESHPALVGERTWRFQEQLASRGSGPVLEVAMGLETTHPEALARLNKRMTLERFAAAARQLAAHGVRLRVFLLVSPPFIEAPAQDMWLARSVATAFDCGASVVSLIPTRSGNGAMEAIEADGYFRPPDLSDLERAMDTGLSVAATLGSDDRVVLADTWDLAQFSACDACLEPRRARLAAMNATQQSQTAMSCDRCGALTT
jgi:archaeosine synthase beta-subunit